MDRTGSVLRRTAILYCWAPPGGPAATSMASRSARHKVCMMHYYWPVIMMFNFLLSLSFQLLGGMQKPTLNAFIRTLLHCFLAGYGEILTIRDEEENDFIRQQLQPFKNVALFVWLGMEKNKIGEIRVQSTFHPCTLPTVGHMQELF